MALDRAFDRDPIVLLHAYAGSGKTTVAAEFARWYAKTGGVDGPVLWSSFEHAMPLPRLLDHFGQAFGPALEQAGIHWPAIVDEKQRLAIALQALAQAPVLWVWDNVEPVAGFPAGAPSAWSEAEQRELAGFLRALRATKAKVLLTSRRDERRWLGDLPTRVSVPPMPSLERLQLARVLADKHGRRLAEVEDWRPLLAFTEGNPLTLTVLVGQALRQGIKTRAQIVAFVERLRTGEEGFEDEAEEGRSRSLGASLAYGFENAFSEEERRRLAVLSLFQGFVNVEVLRLMGDANFSWCLAEVRGIGRREWITLLERAVEIGLLVARGDGFYGIHPALPWFFRALFERAFPQRELAAIRAFAEVMGEIADSYFRRYMGGNRDALDVLAAEEANLLHGYRQARSNGWWRRVIHVLQGLRVLYDHLGRKAEWRRLIEDVVQDLVDPEKDGPLPGREEQWLMVTDYRVGLAMEDRRWEEAERLLARLVEWTRGVAASALAIPASKLGAEQWIDVQNLATAVLKLGGIQREQNKAACVAAFEDALAIAEFLGYRPLAAIAAYNLGQAYFFVPDLDDLEQSAHWFERSLELHDSRDGLGRGRCASQLGTVALERSRGALASRRSEEEILAHLNEAARRLHEALELLPPDATGDRAGVYNQLGLVYTYVADWDRALANYRQSIRLREAEGDLYGASQVRFHVARALLEAGRLDDGREYAAAALRGFESFGEGAGEMALAARQLLEESPS